MEGPPSWDRIGIDPGIEEEETEKRTGEANVFAIRGVKDVRGVDENRSRTGRAVRVVDRQSD